MHIDRFTIATTHTGAMTAFYDALFDAEFEPVEDTPFLLGYMLGAEVLFCPNDIVKIKAEKNRIQFRVVVDDVDTLVARSEEYGGGPYGDRYEDDDFIAWGVHDPDGNSLELIQEK